jgi:exodeoxyribonuclease-3
VYEIRSLLRGVAEYQQGFHVIAGDFNTLAPGEQLDLRRLPARLRAFTWMTGRTIRWRTIRLMLDGGYVDVYRMFHKEDPGYTLPTWDPHVRLDYAFVQKAFTGRVKSCEIGYGAPGAKDASDHFPLLVVME